MTSFPTDVWDIHAHGVPAKLVHALERNGADLGATLLTTPAGRVLEFADGERTAVMRDDIIDLGTRLRRMDDAGIGGQVVAPWIDLCAYGLDRVIGARFSRAVNTHLAEMVSAHPDRLAALATVPLQDPPAAAAELRFAVQELGMMGVQIGTTVGNKDLHDPLFEEFWKAAEDLHCIVLLHPHQGGLAGRAETPYFMGNLIGNPSESTIAVGSLVFGGVLERFPDLVVVAVHGGGFVPWQSARWDHGYNVLPGLTAANLTRPPSEYLARIYYDTVLHDPQKVRELVEWAGVHQVVLGSDYPFPMGDSHPLDSLAALSDLDEASRSAIVGGTVRALISGVTRPRS